MRRAVASSYPSLFFTHSTGRFSSVFRQDSVAESRGQPSKRWVVNLSLRQEAPLSEINWAVELRKIEREFDGLPPEPTPTELRHKRDSERKERERQDAANASFGVYFRLTLVLCLAVSLACWPYEVSCGATLSGYLGAVLMLIVAGVWTATATFTHQMPKRHLTAVLVVLWGLLLGAAQVLPRIGYANPAPGRPTTWDCVSQ